MRKEERAILELCRPEKDAGVIASLTEEEGFDWQYFINTVKHHRIAPLALEELMTQSPQCMKNRFLAGHYRELVVRTVLRREILVSELARVGGVLRGDHIEFILLKGLSLDFSGLRTIGDMDILVREGELFHAMSSLRRAGYHYVGHLVNRRLARREKTDIRLQLSWNHEYHLFNDQRNMMIELHTNLFERKRGIEVNLDVLLDNIDWFWRNKRHDERLGCYTLSQEDLLVLMGLHCALKRSPPAYLVLRTVLDIDGLINHGADLKRALETSIELGVTRYLYFSLLLCQKLLGITLPAHVVEDFKNSCSRWQVFLTDVHLRACSSLNAHPIVHTKLYQVLSPVSWGRGWRVRLKWLFLLPILFPSRWRIEEIFGLKERSPAAFFFYPINSFRWVCLVVKRGMDRVKQVKL